MTETVNEQGGDGDEGLGVEEGQRLEVTMWPLCSLCGEYGGHTGQCWEVS